MSQPHTRVALGAIESFTAGKLYRVETPKRPLAFVIAVTATGDVHVLDDLCTHANARLSDGWLEEPSCLACPWHGAQFDLATGKALSLPATGHVPVYEAIIEDGTLYVEFEPDDSDQESPN